jgi:hypothetical protein
VIEASKAYVCVFVDCAWGKANEALSRKYGIRGYPDVVLVAPDGKASRTASRDAAGVAADLREFLARSGTPKPPPAGEPSAEIPKIEGKAYAAARAEALKAKKFLLYVLLDESPASTALSFSLADESLRSLLGLFVRAKGEYRRNSEEAARFSVERAPTVLVVDPRNEKVLLRVAGSRSPRELARDFEEASRARETPAGEPTPAPKPKDDPAPVADADVDAAFFQSRLNLALEYLRTGKKEKGVGILEDLIKTYPKHPKAEELRKMLEDARK